MKKILGIIAMVITIFTIASCGKKTFNIKFTDYDGSVIKEELVKKGNEINYPTDPNRDGYTFIGWDYEDKLASEDILINAKYEINEYTVTFLSDTGSVFKEIEVNYDGSANIEEKPIKEGYDFIGWDRELSNIKTDLLVKPIFEIKVFNVVIKNEKEEQLLSYKVNYGENISRPNLENDVFVEEVEYYLDDEIYNFDDPVFKDINLTAKYNYKNVSIDINVDENIDVENIVFGKFEVTIQLKFKLGFKVSKYSNENGLVDIQDNKVIITSFNYKKGIILTLESSTYSDLPVIVLDTEGIPIISKEDYVDGTFEMYNAGAYNKDLSKLEIRGRGNSTWAQPKKPLRLKFNEKQSMFGTPYKEKNWVLLADYLDITHIKNYFAYNLAQKFTNSDEGMLFAPIAVNVNVYFNGEYQGVFLFADHKDDKRMGVEMEVDETMSEFPFYVEMDDYAKNLKADEFFTTAIGGVDRHFDIKYPEPKHRLEDNPQLQYNYIKNYIEETELAIRTQTNYQDYIDVKSFVDFYLINHLMENTDIFYKSVHMVKRNDEKLRLGPVWDFDWGVGGPISSFVDKDSDYKGYSNSWSGYSTTWWMALIKDDAFVEQVKVRWEIISKEVDLMMEHLNDYKPHVKDDVIRELNTWGRYQNTTNPLLTFDGQYQYVLDRLIYRQDWITKQIEIM